MTANDSFQDVWNAAALEYEAQTGRKPEKDAVFRKFQTLEDLEEHVRQKGEGFESFRDQHEKLLSRMARCFKPLVPILDVVKSGIGSSPYAPAAVAFGAASYLLQACEKVTKCYDAVEELFHQIENITIRLKEYGYENMRPSLKTKTAQMLAYILEIMGRVEKIVRRQRIKQWARSLFLDDDEISSSLKKLRNFAEDELGLVVALTFARVGEIQDATEDIRKDVGEILNRQNSERLRVSGDTYEKRILKTLQTGAFYQNAAKYVQNTEALTKGTGFWIKADPLYQAWEQEKAKILWVFGRPGVGKTMLATRTIEALKASILQQFDARSPTTVSYIFFKDDDPDLRNCTQMLKAAAAQIAALNRHFKSHVVAVLETQDDVFASARRAWDLLFLDFFTRDSSKQGQTSSTFIIVDGLDEAPQEERMKFLGCLSDLTDKDTDGTHCRIQVAIFARPEVRADVTFDRIGTHCSAWVTITPTKNSSDTGAFVRQHLGEVLVLKHLRRKKATKEYEALAKHIFFTVQSRSQGMFLWASLVLDQIRDLPSSEAVKASLAQAPGGLDDMLHRVFKRFEKEEKMRQSYLRDLLIWVLCTYRPLSISELFVLLYLSAGQQCISIQQDLENRYSSIFSVTGPTGEDVQGDGQSEQDEEVIEPEIDKFDFLNMNDEDVDATGAESNPTNEDEPALESSPNQATNAIYAAQNIISDSWRTAVVTFGHARFRDCTSNATPGQGAGTIAHCSPTT